MLPSVAAHPECNPSPSPLPFGRPAPMRRFPAARAHYCRQFVTVLCLMTSFRMKNCTGTVGDIVDGVELMGCWEGVLQSLAEIIKLSARLKK